MATTLEQIAGTAIFELEIFDGLLKVEGRVITPAESEAAGLSSTLLASELLSSDSSGSSILKLQEEIKDKPFEELQEEQLKRLMDYAKRIRPESLIQISEKEDELLCRIIRRGSQDQGATWEPLRLVPSLDMQDAKNGLLWVGVLTKEDRQLILDEALVEKKGAGSRLKNFL